ncbi:UNVERIFIED_CONTAM: putative AC transposase [Sesamum radiatum]|uniref:AC transposase n=1 Tax=Sesamum radiatum TaxID=300843 RepID=A0AAW2ME50_SESRA
MSTSRSESSQPTSLHSSGHSGDNDEVTTQSRSSKRKQSVVWEHFTKVRDFKLPCRNTIRGHVIEVYEEEKIKVYKLLDGLGCKVSLTTDIWTSDHSHVAYCCLTAHFVDDSWELQKKILAFRKMSYPHDGETSFNFMKEMILEWNLDKKLFSIVVDNATNNDVMIRKVKDWILYDLLVARDVDLLHVRCSAHILNLIVQDGLNEIRGLIDKIRKTVRYLNKSPAATQKFEMALNQCNLAYKRKVAMDMPNRWNSTYELLATALPLKEAFSRLQRIDKNYYGNPSESEWIYSIDAHSYIQMVRDKLISMFIDYGGSCVVSVNDLNVISSSGVETRASLRDFDRWCYESRVLNNQKSELESYLEEARFPRANTFNILDWWKTNSPRLPILAKIARDILAVPATTVALEAVFSVGGRVIDKSHTCLLPDALEALVVADDWIRSILKRLFIMWNHLELKHIMLKVMTYKTIEGERE